MGKIDKYRGVFPAFYACYDDSGRISPDRTRAMARFLIGKGVDGLYAVSYTHLDVYKRQLQGGSTSAEISQLFLIDLVYTEYYRRHFENCRENNQKTSGAVLDKLY